VSASGGEGGREVFSIRDEVEWDLMGGMPESVGGTILMEGRITHIRVTRPHIAVVKDVNGESWLVDLAETRHKKRDS
jgi:hypothetical protein